MSTRKFQIIEHVVDSCYIREYPFATSQHQETIFKLSVRQYVPLVEETNLSSPTPAITIIASGACAFPKEVYEPLWDDLYMSCKAQGVSIRSIWSADPANMSTSSVLNRDQLGDDPSWIDHARDLLLLVNRFQKQMPRPLIGVGHSYGGNHIANVALLHPRLFHSVILLDPSIILQSTDNLLSALPPYGFLNLVAYRQSSWTSSRSAKAALVKSPLIRGWDKRCIAILEQQYFQETSAGSGPSATIPQEDQLDRPVCLKTSPAQEVYAMARPTPSRDTNGNVIPSPATHPDLHPLDTMLPIYRAELRRTWQNLVELRPSALFVMAKKSLLCVDEMHLAALHCGTGVGGSGGIEKGRVQEVFFSDAGHFFPMQQVARTSSVMSKWLKEETERWNLEESMWIAERDAKSARGDFSSSQLNSAMKQIISQPNIGTKQIAKAVL